MCIVYYKILKPFLNIIIYRGRNKMADRPAENPESTRSVVHAQNGMLATSQPLAANAGLSILQKGDNAFDAAIATADVITDVEPTQTGREGYMLPLFYNQ